MKKIVLVGGGGHCKVIIESIRLCNQYQIVGILDFHEGEVLGIPVIGDDDMLQELYNEGVESAVICIGGLNNPSIRQKVRSGLKAIGFNLPVISHPSSIISDTARIGEGTCIMAGAIINADAQIGEITIINTSAVIEHECVIGDNTHVSSGAVVLGGVEIGENTLIGARSVIRQGIQVGDNSIIGAGSVVVKNILSKSTVYGNPAKVKE